MTFIAFNTIKDKGIGIGLLCVLPVLVLVIFAISFSIKTKRDLCNASNYTCAPPTSNPTTTTSTTTSTKPKTNAQNQALPQKLYEKFDIRSCGEAHPKPSDSLIDSSSSIKGYKIISYVFICFTVLVIVLIGFFHELDRKRLWSILIKRGNIVMNAADTSSYRVWWMSLILILALIITTIVYLAKKQKQANNTHIGFSISFINLLIALILAMFYTSEKKVSAFFFAKPDSPTSYAYVILGLILVIFVIGTIYFHTSQEENLDEGKITYAINESVVNMMAPIMLVIALANLLVGGGMVLFGIKKADKPRILFGGTQLISGILLIAGAAYFYNYKAKCSSATVVCDYRSKNINRTSGEDMCIPDSGMSMTHTGAVTMSTSINVIMALTQIVSTVAIILIKLSKATAAAAAPP